LAAYCPDVGDIIWLDFLQAIANEQAGRQPALMLSPRAFNELTGRCVSAVSAMASTHVGPVTVAGRRNQQMRRGPMGSK